MEPAGLSRLTRALLILRAVSRKLSEQPFFETHTVALIAEVADSAAAASSGMLISTLCGGLLLAGRRRIVCLRRG